MAKRKKTFSKGLTIFISIVLFALSAVGGFIGYHYLHRPTDSDPLISGDMEIHFPELGNKYTGDCTYIKVGDVDVLIDAGSHATSIPTLASYLKEHMTDDVIEYVIITHAHEDHYAGFATGESTDSLFDLFSFETIIDFAQVEDGKENKAQYKNYIRERDAEVAAGAKHYTADKCVGEPYLLGNGVEMEILDSYFYYHNESKGENNHSVCTLFRSGEDNFLFTGDLEKKGEEYLVEMNDLPKVTLYKAGHHGSKTSSNDCLLEVIQPEIVTVCCCAGSPEYTKTNENQFPTQAFVDRIAPYTDKVYVTTLCVNYEEDKFTSFNGTIVITCAAQGVSVSCSKTDTVLKDSDWFRQNRTYPTAWQ